MLNKLKHRYGDMKLQSKFTIALVLAVTVPLILLGVFFYGKLYEMTVSYTIRREQDISAKTSPQIDHMLLQVTDTYDALSEEPFYQTLFHQPVNAPFSMLAASKSGDTFCQSVMEKGAFTG